MTRPVYHPQIKRILFASRRKVAFKLIGLATMLLASAAWLYGLH